MDSTKRKDRLCLYCKADGIIAKCRVKNFTRHLRDSHNGRYQELMLNGRDRCTNPEYLKDYIFTDDLQ